MDALNGRIANQVLTVYPEKLVLVKQFLKMFKGKIQRVMPVIICTEIAALFEGIEPGD